MSRLTPEFLPCLSFFVFCFFVSSLQSGYSRFPVHEPGNPTSFIGLLLIKKVTSFFFIYRPKSIFDIFLFLFLFLFTAT